MGGVKATLSRLWGRPQPTRPPLRPPRGSRAGLPAVGVTGVGPGGEAAVAVAGDEVTAGGVVVLVFLTSSCQGCREFWEALAGPGAARGSAGGAESGSGSGPGGRAAELPGAPTLIIVTPGPELEDRRKVAELARGAGSLDRGSPGGVRVVMSARAWADYDVTRSPFAVVVREGKIAGEAPLFCWDDLRGLLVRLEGAAAE